MLKAFNLPFSSGQGGGDQFLVGLRLGGSFFLVVAKQMGHADWKMIAREYGRWMPDADSNGWR